MSTSMSSPASDRSTRYARVGTEEAQPDGEGRSTSDIAERHFGNGPSGSNDSVIDGRPRISLPASPVSSLSEHSDHISRPTSLEKKSRTSSADLDEKKSESPDAKQPGWWSRLVEDSWTVELVSGFVSFAAIASIIGVLWGYDQKPVPPLTFGITLNAVISFLATISRSAIMLCIGTVIAQSKWLWFRKERSLIDLENIESASRGPLGSILMLFSFRGGVVPYVAAFLTVITLGFDPFVQQLLTTQGRVVRIPASGIGINSTTSMTLEITSAMEYPETLAQLTAAMLADVQQEDQPFDISTKRKRSDATTETLALPLKAACPSGNCIWQPYHALDICTQCRTTTEELTIKNLTPESSDLPAMISDALAAEKLNNDQYLSNFTWGIIPKTGRTWRVDSNLTAFVNENDMDGTPTGLETHGAIVHKLVWPLNFADASNGFSLDTTGWTKQRYAGIDQPVAALGFAELDFDHNGLPALNYSLECAVTYCVKEYNRSVVQGNLVSNVLSTHYGTVSGDPDVYSDLSWSATVNGTSFTADAFLGYGTGIGTMVGYLLGNTTHEYSGGCSAGDGWSCSAPVTSNSGTYGAISTEAWQGIDLTPDFTTVLENVNTLMSEILQQYGNVTVVGENAVTKSFVVVRWAWIALPATVVFFGLIVLGLTVWEITRLQAPSWKSSLLPLLYRYVHVDEGSAERPRNIVPKGPSSNGSVPAPDSRLMSTNLVSKFAVEAEATVTRLTKETSALQVWQLQSLETVHADTKRWWQLLKR